MKRSLRHAKSTALVLGSTGTRGPAAPTRRKELVPRTICLTEPAALVLRPRRASSPTAASSREELITRGIRLTEPTAFVLRTRRASSPTAASSTKHLVCGSRHSHHRDRTRKNESNSKMNMSQKTSQKFNTTSNKETPYIPLDDHLHSDQYSERK